MKWPLKRPQSNELSAVFNSCQPLSSQVQVGKNNEESFRQNFGKGLFFMVKSYYNMIGVRC